MLALFQVIGANNVAVPTHFFKVILAETSPGNFEMECFVLPNQVRIELNYMDQRRLDAEQVVSVHQPRLLDSRHDHSP